MPPRALVEQVAGRLQLLSDPTRLQILCALAQGESHVGCLADLANASVQTASQHLAKLRLAGVVRSRRDGQHMIYELVDTSVGDVLAPLFEELPAKMTTAAPHEVVR